MPRFISWTAYVRRKDRNPLEIYELSLISEEALKIDPSAGMEWKEWKEAPLDLSNIHASNVMVMYFDTESNFALSDICDDLEEFTRLHPEYLFSVYAQFWDDFTASRINFADGESETTEGFFQYAEPKNIRF